MAIRDFLKRIAARFPCMPSGTHNAATDEQHLAAPIPAFHHERGVPTYDADFLTVWHKSTDFLKDQKFMAAYKAGMDSGHKIARPAGSSEDIHIEWRIHICCWAAWHAKQLPGDFVECGTNTGIMSLAVANYIDFNSTGKAFFLFDTFQGIPEDQITPYERLLGRAQENEKLYEDCYERARMNFAPFPKAKLVRGKVPHTLASMPIDHVCYLCLDMNIVVPEQAAIEYFWDKLVPGAPVILDDYGWLNFGKQKEAMDTFAARKGVKIANLPTGQGLLFKP
ncbi:MAG: MtfD protein [Nitrospira defluvii]|nr:MtfD protein [Nitrospira defluvii]